MQKLRAETYLVFKGHPSGNTIGVVHFRNGKLVWASRDVGAFEGEAVRTFAQTLFEVLAEVIAEDRTPILITKLKCYRLLQILARPLFRDYRT